MDARKDESGGSFWGNSLMTSIMGGIGTKFTGRTLSKNILPTIISFFLFYVAWYACLFAGKYNYGAWVYLVTLVYAVAIAFFQPLTMRQSLHLLPLLLTGLCFDYIAVQFHWIQFLYPQNFYLLPHWVIAIWLMFLVSLPQYLEFLGHRLRWAAPFGAVFGPISYVYGKLFGLLIFPHSQWFIFYGIFWFFFFPISLAWMGGRKRRA